METHPFLASITVKFWTAVFMVSSELPLSNLIISEIRNLLFPHSAFRISHFLYLAPPGRFQYTSMDKPLLLLRIINNSQIIKIDPCPELYFREQGPERCNSINGHCAADEHENPRNILLFLQVLCLAT
jgi:hypothetical protein